MVYSSDVSNNLAPSPRNIQWKHRPARLVFRYLFYTKGSGFLPVQFRNHWYHVQLSRNQGSVRNRWIRKHFNIKWTIPNMPRNTTGIFVRQLAILESSPCVNNCSLIHLYRQQFWHHYFRCITLYALRRTSCHLQEFVFTHTTFTKASHYPP